MRTRRSPRNQDRLWRELGGKKGPRPDPPRKRTPEEIDAMFWIPKPERERMKKESAT